MHGQLNVSIVIGFVNLAGSVIKFSEIIKVATKTQSVAACYRLSLSSYRRPYDLTLTSMQISGLLLQGCMHLSTSKINKSPHKLSFQISMRAGDQKLLHGRALPNPAVYK